MSLIEQTVSMLLDARSRHTAVPAPMLPDADAAYAVQASVALASGWFGGNPPRHWKSGGPSREAVQTHAPLPPAGVFQSPADLQAWPLHLRGIEAEVALRLREPVDAARAATLDQATAAALVDAMCVSIEVIDTRWDEGLQANAFAKLADLQAHGALVLGDWVPYAARDWAAQHCSVRIGRSAVHEFVGTHSMGDPAQVLPRWTRHATRDGATIPAGAVVTTGTWCGILHAQMGDAVEVRFDGIGQAALQF